jgi:hypothetical protein
MLRDFCKERTHRRPRPLPSRTDARGEYYAQFDSNGSQYVTNFAVVLSYQRCEASHVELDFSDTLEVKIQSFTDIDDSGQECQPTQPNCFRK